MRHDKPFPPRLDCLSVAQQFFEEWVATADPARESLWVVHVDEQGNCLHVARYQGDETSAPVPLKKIVSDALEHETAGILLAHNHPGGQTHPSMADLRVTRYLASCMAALDCAVLDHLIFAGAECTSFREKGLL